jgi:hypothetical protein
LPILTTVGWFRVLVDGTPIVQLIVDPVRNPTVDVLAFFGIQLRVAF